MYHNYSISSYPWTGLLQVMYGTTKDLDALHEEKERLQQELKQGGIAFDDPIYKPVFSSDQSSCFHRIFYKSPLFEEFTRIYQQFVVDCVLALFPSHIRFAVQKSPTFRVHMPNTSALGENHELVSERIYRQKKAPLDALGLHNDSMYKHPKGEINFIVPLTEVWDTNSVWIETAVDSNEYLPIAAKPGQFFQFDGNRLFHFNKINTTGKSRVSFDFRIVPLPNEEVEGGPSTKVESSLTSGRAFKIGQYYCLLEQKSEHIKL